MSGVDKKIVVEADLADVVRLQQQVSALNAAVTFFATAGSNHQFLDQGGAPVAIGTAQTNVILATFTPTRAPSRVRVQVNYKVINDGAGIRTVTPQLSGLPEGIIYTGEAIAVPAVASEAAQDFIQAEFTLPTTSAATVNFSLAADASAHITVGTHGASMIIQELLG